MNTARVLLRKTFIGYFMSSKEWGGKARTHGGRFVSPQGKRRRIYSSAIATASEIGENEQTKPGYPLSIA